MERPRADIKQKSLWGCHSPTASAAGSAAKFADPACFATNMDGIALQCKKRDNKKRQIDLTHIETVRQDGPGQTGVVKQRKQDESAKSMLPQARIS